MYGEWDHLEIKNKAILTVENAIYTHSIKFLDYM